MVDAILDNYFATIDAVNSEIGALEPVILCDPDKSVLIPIENKKRSVLMIRKSLLPLKEGIAALIRSKSTLIKKSSLTYYKDLANSISAAIEETDSALKALEGLTKIYFASLSQKMNETMKVLTTVATIFIPLTFIELGT